MQLEYACTITISEALRNQEILLSGKRFTAEKIHASNLRFFSNVGNMCRRRDLYHRKTCWIKLNKKFEHGQTWSENILHCPKRYSNGSQQCYIGSLWVSLNRAFRKLTPLPPSLPPEKGVPSQIKHKKQNTNAIWISAVLESPTPEKDSVSLGSVRLEGTVLRLKFSLTEHLTVLTETPIFLTKSARNN